MTINVLANAFKAALNTASAGQLADMFRAMKLGDVIRSLPVQLNDAALQAAATNPYAIAAAQTITLPDDCKAAVVLAAVARAGTGTKGPLTIAAPGNSAPGATNILICGSGDLCFHAADAYTAVDVFYLPIKGDLQEQILPVTSGNTTVTLPTTLGTAHIVLEAEGTAGGTPGKKIVDIPGGTPSAGHASMSFDGKTVLFAAGDSHTTARVKYAATAAVDINALLETLSNFF